MKTPITQTAQEKEEVKRPQIPQLKKNHDMGELNIKDILELVTSFTKSQSSLEPLVQIYSIRTLAEMMRQQQQPLPTPQSNNDFMNKMLEFAMAMKFFDMFEKKLSSGKEEDFMKMLQMFQMLQNSKADMQQLAQVMLQMQQMINQSQEKNVELMKELFFKKKEEDEEKFQQIIQIIDEMKRRWDEEKIEMFRNFQETLRQLTERKAPFEEIRRFMEEYEEFRRLEQQLKELVKGTELEKQPITDEKGNLNWEKILYYIDKWFFGGKSGLSSLVSPPPKKEVKQVDTSLIPQFKKEEAKQEVKSIEVQDTNPALEQMSELEKSVSNINTGNVEVIGGTNNTNEQSRENDFGNTEQQGENS